MKTSMFSSKLYHWNFNTKQMPGLEKNLNFSLPRLGQTALTFSLPHASFNLLF